MSLIKNTTFKYLSNFTNLSSFCMRRMILVLMNDFTSGICYFLSLYLVEILQYRLSIAGIIVSSYGLGTVFGGITIGKLSEKYSSNLLSRVTILIKAVAFAILIIIHSPGLLAVNAFVLGFCAYGFSTANNLSILEYYKHDENQKLKIMNLIYMFTNLGIGLAGVVVSIFAKNHFNQIFFLSSILLFSCLLFFLGDGSGESTKINLRENFDDRQCIAAQSSKKALAIVLCCVFFSGLIMSQMSATYTIYIKEIFPDLGYLAVGILFVLNPIIIVLFQVPIVGWFGKFNKLQSIGIGSFFIGIGMIFKSGIFY